ncbi:CHAP domain-containing protein [Rhodopila sp.]|jgi:surface antigen|uniref:CHAP domain-containing protein n=1 Tax=Rhodopila sp. TaxID=2480087 RepID=UPI002D1BE2DA|nr:CHAP domain-containing protein [Rhodopila sp.]HVZ07240.1 CHAP domain-containing protein [Rhodopila sp.]
MSCLAARLLPLLCLVLAACGSTRPSPESGSYVGGSVAIECAPFARALTGVNLTGDAADWWPQAAGRYQRSANPDVGSLLVFRRSSRLPSGHVAVVSQVLSARQIRVSQANWVHHRVTRDQSIVDVSPAGDWTQVRVFWPPTGQLGTTVYPTFGFIHPDRPPSSGAIAQRTPEAIRTAQAGW